MPKKLIKYVPHGVSNKSFFPIPETDPNLIQFKQQLFGGNQIDFAFLYNSRNVRRKSPSDVLLAFRIFADTLPVEQQKRIALVCKTDVSDDNGTDLGAVKRMLFEKEGEPHIVFVEQPLSTEGINLLYNSIDCTVLISSNEGWGLSLTESLTVGKPIIANVTGGMQDQMRFEDETGKWIDFDEKFSSNHRGKYKTCGPWAIPVFPSNISLVGSPPTPYIFDDRCAPEDVAKAMQQVYEMPKQERELRGRLGREWVTGDEARMTAEMMTESIMDGIEETLDVFEPRANFDLFKIVPLENQDYIKYPLAI